MSFQTIPQLRQALADVRAQLTAAEAELAQQQEELQAFQTQYDANINPLMRQVAFVEAQVEDYLEQIRTLRDQHFLGHGYRSADAQYRAKWRHDPLKEKQERVERPSADKAPPEAQIKKLYRKLARQYHPDLAQSDAERAIRTEKMAAINDAYAAGSLVELIAAANDLEAAVFDAFTTSLGSQTEAAMTQALQKELMRCQQRLAAVKLEIQNFHLRPEVELALESKFAARRGRNLLAEMQAELEKRLARKTAELEMLAAQFRGLSAE